MNARLVTPEGVFPGGLVLREGRIQALECGLAARSTDDLDLGGDYLLPGFVDVHTDNLERLLVPRPGVLWPDGAAAARMHDALMAASGVTTVLDSVAAGVFPEGAVRRELYQRSLATLRALREQDGFRAEHLLHLRVETADPEARALMDAAADDPALSFVSLMDHTPGQRQYQDLASFRAAYKDEHWTDAEFAAVVARYQENQAIHGPKTRQAALELARARGAVLGSHDDTSEDHVRQGHAEGCTVCEFPTTRAAARLARELGMEVVMGGPNVVRGGSHSGNVSVVEVARAGALTVLASDYMPPSLLAAVFLLPRALGMALHAAVALATVNPARMLGLTDRGALAPGQRADLLRVRTSPDEATGPELLGVWRAGGRIW